MAPAGRGAAAILAGAVLAAAAGCTHSTRVYPYEAETVWQACIAECVIWRPDMINEDHHVITSTRVLLGGGEVSSDLKVTRLPPIMKRPRTRVSVRMAQTKPKTVRFTNEETRLLDRLGQMLKHYRPPPTGRPVP